MADGQHTIEDMSLLVSDSNEVSSQYDSKRMQFNTFVELAQDTLFKRNEGMAKYLTHTQFETYRQMLDKELQIQADAFASTSTEWSGMYKAVEGQIILLKVEEVPSDTTPKEYVRKLWDIPADLTLIQLYGGMPRGVTFIKDGSEQVFGEGNEKVVLTEGTVPPHAHHSGLTSGSTMQTVQVGGSGTSASQNDGLPYDVFKNDALATGMDGNEIEGVVDEFEVQPTGSSDHMAHNNMPVYEKFYAFAVQKIT